MKTLVKKALPTPISAWMRRRYYELLNHDLGRNLREDYVDLILGRRTKQIPPRRLMFEGPQDYVEFKENGLAYLKHFVNLCGLRPDEGILDVGCGIGRKTIPLVTFLSKKGEYWGIDLKRIGVEWCQKTIARKNPNFHFQVIDVYNQLYNPTGSQKASQYVFPFPDNRFDFVVLGSVFTHLLPTDLENYLSEIVRVLKPGKRCLITYFLSNKESLELITERRSTLNFSHQCDGFRTVNLQNPETAVLYDQEYILDLYRKHGLTARNPIYYGSWCGRSRYLDYQDIIIGEKRTLT